MRSNRRAALDRQVLAGTGELFAHRPRRIRAVLELVDWMKPVASVAGNYKQICAD